jgi:hypothetical protein
MARATRMNFMGAWVLAHRNVVKGSILFGIASFQAPSVSMQMIECAPTRHLIPMNLMKMNVIG